MNTYFDYLAVAFLFLFPYLLAVVAFRAIRERSLMAVKVYRRDTERVLGDNRWEYQGAASRTSGLRWRWPFMALAPRWFLPEESRTWSPIVVPWKQFRDTDDYNVQRFYKDDEYFLLVRRPDRTVLVWLVVIDILLVALIAVALWLNFHAAALRAREIISAPEPTHTPTPTQIATAPTSAPRPTATSTPEVEVIDGGDALVVDLDRDVPPSEFWRRLNEALNASCELCPPIPTIPIPDWVWDIIGDWEFTVIRLPEGMDGYIVAYQTPYGMAVQRVDDQFDQIGNPEALAESEVTIEARDRRFGIGYGSEGWDKPINGYRGNTVLTVTESGSPAMIVEARGFAYNFRLWHIVILIIVIIGGVVVYRRLTY